MAGRVDGTVTGPGQLPVGSVVPDAVVGEPASVPGAEEERLRSDAAREFGVGGVVSAEA